MIVATFWHPERSGSVPPAPGRGTWSRRVGRPLLRPLAAVVAGVLGLVVALRLRSGQDPAPFLDEHGTVLAGSVSEKVRVDINGVRQGMVIRGHDVTNPVLLVVHGGPGMPDYFLTRDYPTDIEDLFTVV